VLRFRIVIAIHPVDFVGKTVQLDYQPYKPKMSPFDVYGFEATSIARTLT
jgi:hypothetical protein